MLSYVLNFWGMPGVLINCVLIRKKMCTVFSREPRLYRRVCPSVRPSVGHAFVFDRSKMGGNA